MYLCVCVCACMHVSIYGWHVEEHACVCLYTMYAFRIGLDSCVVCEVYVQACMNETRHTHILTCMCTNETMHTNTNTYTHTCICMNETMHTYIHIHIHMHTYEWDHACIESDCCGVCKVCMYICVHGLHTYIQTYTYAHIQASRRSCSTMLRAGGQFPFTA
jgi:hypothetical protein